MVQPIAQSQYKFSRPLNLNEFEYARRLHDEYKNCLQHDSKNFDRCMTNNRLYWAVDTDRGYGQIPAPVVAEMIRIGKQPGAYNVCRPAVDNIVGGFLQAPLSFDFRPVDSEISSLTYMARDIIFAESELMDWSVADMKGDIDSCIYRADYEMYIDRRSYKEPHVGWRVLPPGEVVWPPKLNDLHRERKKVYRRRMMTPLDAIELFSGGKEKIVKAVMYKQYGEKALEELARIQVETGETFGPNSGVVPFSNNTAMWGSQYEFIMCYHMERVTHEYEYALTEEGDKAVIPSDLKDPAAKMEWLNNNAPGWRPDAVFVDEEEVNVQYMAVICPQLAEGMLICDGPTDVQCGMLSIAPRSAYFKEGEFGGLIDSIKDIQLSINWIQNTLQYRLHVDGEGTAWYAFPEAFITPAEYQRWVECKNKAGEVFAMKPGMEQKYPNGPAIPVQKSPYPREATDRLESLLKDLLPLIGKYTPASRGQAESSGESGYLFNLKKLQNDVERKVLFEGRRQFRNLMGEMWLGAAAQIHGGKLGKKFFNPRTGKVIEANKRVVETTPEGDQIEYIVNDLSKLKDIRHRVIIVESADSPTKQAQDMQVANELISAIKNPNAVPVSYVRLTHALLKGAANLSEDEKAEAEEIYALEIELAIQTAKTNIAVQKANEAQANATLQQLTQPQPQAMPGTPGVGAPAGVGGSAPGDPGQVEPVGTMQEMAGATA